MSLPGQSASSPPRPKEAGDGGRAIGDVWQWLGLGGDAVGTSGIFCRTFFYGLAATAAVSGVVNADNVIGYQHAMPHGSLAGPLIWEGSSWLSLVVFFWIPWIAYRLAPLSVRPRWRLVLHVPFALAFALAHVGFFVLLRSIAYRAMGAVYDFGSPVPQFLYEFRKDALGYVLIIAGFALVEHLLRQQQLIAAPGQTLTFDIRDGAKLARVRLSDILAVSSAGNYVEFVLNDGRRLMMRSPLSAVESDLGDRGFVRTHRSWLVNGAAVTGLTPEGSGDYSVAVGALSIPLSRRFPEALARLRQG